MVTMDAARTQWSSAEVVRGVTRLAAEGRAVTADLIALLAVLDERRLFEAEGCGSLFEFCVTRLRLSESQAYHRIQAARAAARFPVILEHLREGPVTLTSVALLRPVLTDENHAQLLREAAGRTKREVECLVRSLAPLPDVPVSIRKVARGSMPAVAADRAREPLAVSRPSAAEPESLAYGSLVRAGMQAPRAGDPGMDEMTIEPGPVQSASTAAVPARPAEIRPLAPTRYSLRVTISEATHAKLRRCQDLLGHAVPDGDPAAILDRALTLLVAQLERRTFAATTRRCVGSRSSVPRPRRRPTPTRHTSTTAASLQTAALAPETTVRSHGGAAVMASGATVRLDKGTATAAVAGDMPSPPPELAERHAARPRSRHIPAAVRRAVWARDEGRCGYVGHSGRCTQTRRLEFHHRVPFADGGAATVENLSLRCRAHNGTEARHWFGEEASSATTLTGQSP